MKRSIVCEVSEFLDYLVSKGLDMPENKNSARLLQREYIEYWAKQIARKIRCNNDPPDLEQQIAKELERQLVNYCVCVC